MSLYDAVKDMISIAQKMDNVDLTRQLFDIQQQAFELQEENYRLRIQIHKMEEEMRTEAEIERHSQPYLTLAGDKNHIPYCATCWGTGKQRIQMAYKSVNTLACPSCGILISKEMPKPYHSPIE